MTFTFHPERDKYGRHVHVVVDGPGRYVGERVGAIVRMPKSYIAKYGTEKTYMVNDYRITRRMADEGRSYQDGLQYTASLKTAKALFA